MFLIGSDCNVSYYILLFVNIMYKTEQTDRQTGVAYSDHY